MKSEINKVAAGEAVEGVVLYWDSADPATEGPAYRYGKDSGPLEFADWVGDGEGYCVADYFDGDGRYLGPDMHGVYPTFSD